MRDLTEEEMDWLTSSPVAQWELLCVPRSKLVELFNHRDLLLKSNGDMAIEAMNYRVEIGELKAKLKC